ncbi:MAG: helix-turn-helix domain-containing protein [Oscillospiraceae bacterium]|nr:helix-turn-helix domain-containing protein [Oscillospiraceae bacterium]
MSIIYRIDVLAALKAKGYNTTRLRKEKIFGERVIQQMREHQIVSWATIDKLCSLLECQPGDIVEYIDNKSDLNEDTH